MNKKIFLTGVLSAIAAVSVSVITIPERTSADAAEGGGLEVVHYYSFDDTVNDAVGNVNGILSQNDKSPEATDAGLPQYSEEVRTGASGKSLYFNGSNFLWFQNNIFSMEGDFTVSFWMNPTVPDGVNARMISSGVWGANTPGILLGINNNAGGWSNLINGVGKEEGEGAFNWGTAFSELNDQWRHVTAVYNNTDQYYKIFVDGKELQNQSLAGGYQPKSNWGETALGGQLDINSNTVAEAFTGYIDDVIVLKGAAVSAESDTAMFNKLSAADIQYDVTFDSGEGSAVSPEKVYWGNPLSPIPQTTATDPEKHFAGWTLTQGGNELIDENTKFYANTTVYAFYSASEVTVSFVTNCMQNLNAQSVTFGQAATRPSALTKEGYDFDNWYMDAAFQKVYDFSKPVIQNITLYAKWNQRVITVTFNTDGGSEISSMQVEGANLVTEPAAPTKENCIFGGWFTDEARTQRFNFSVSPEGDVTLYAKWYKTENTVSFETNGGNAISSVTVNYNQTFELPEAPVKVGYTFVNWYRNAEFTEIYITIPIVEDLTLYAKWSADEYVIRFETNGGGRIKNVTVKYGVATKEPAAPEKEGYVFEGWYTDEALTQKFEFGNPITSNLNLYAKWSETPTGCNSGLSVGGAAIVGAVVGVALIVKKKGKRSGK